MQTKSYCSEGAKCDDHKDVFEGVPDIRGLVITDQPPAILKSSFSDEIQAEKAGKLKK